MKIFFCPISHEETKNGTSIGCSFAYANKSRWVQAPDDVTSYLTAGYAKGVDHIIVKNKAYMIMKTYIDVTENQIVMVCTESILGCDNKPTV